MTDHIEAVARSICIEHGYDPNMMCDYIGGPGEKPQWTFFIRHATAAIAAYREAVGSEAVGVQYRYLGDTWASDWTWLPPYQGAKVKHEIRSVFAAPPATQPRETLQERVYPWLMECFGPEISADKLERADRFIEEALELLQSGDYPKERVYSLIEYVYGREKGDPAQEVGGVMTTLAAYCLAHGMDMHEAGEKELARVWTKVEKIRAKQAAKPHGSALPIVLESAPAPLPAGYRELLEAAKEFVRKVEAGEARSKRSYAAFKSAIAKSAPTPEAGE